MRYLLKCKQRLCQPSTNGRWGEHQGLTAVVTEVGGMEAVSCSSTQVLGRYCLKDWDDRGSSLLVNNIKDDSADFVVPVGDCNENETNETKNLV